jgi:hypothetical protein
MSVYTFDITIIRVAWWRIKCQCIRLTLLSFVWHDDALMSMYTFDITITCVAWWRIKCQCIRLTLLSLVWHDDALNVNIYVWHSYHLCGMMTHKTSMYTFDITIICMAWWCTKCQCIRLTLLSIVWHDDVLNANAYVWHYCHLCGMMTH